MAATEPRTKSVARAAVTTEPAVRVHGLVKDFDVPHRQVHTIKERVLHPLAHRSYDTLHALRDVSFSVEQGEFFGVVGRNGSGKSTLLKCLAGIYGADQGELRVRGRLSPFIELGVGFNPELAARDNVLINAVMLGLSRNEARARFDDIIAFAELEPFTELKLKNYSSGMSVRLAFATAIQVDADVLLVDEVLAVGDASFQRKCFDEFDRLKEAGRTIVFVTHDMGAVVRYCDRALLLHRGQQRELGDPGSVVRHYNELNKGRLDDPDEPAPSQPDVPAPATVSEAWAEDASGQRIRAVGLGEPCTLCFALRFHEPVEAPILALSVRNEAGHVAFATSSHWTETTTGAFGAGDSVTVRVALDAWIAPGVYWLSASGSRADTGELLAAAIDAADLRVTGDLNAGGVAALPHDLLVERG